MVNKRHHFVEIGQDVTLITLAVCRTDQLDVMTVTVTNVLVLVAAIHTYLVDIVNLNSFR